MASSGTDGGSWREIGRDSLSATVDFARYAGTGASGLLWLVILYALSLGSAFIILSATVFQATTIQGSSENAGRILKVLRVIPERERHIIDQYDVTQTIVIDLKRNLPDLRGGPTTGGNSARQCLSGSCHRQHGIEPPNRSRDRAAADVESEGDRLARLRA
ncbi:MAG: hypothetical protein ACMVO3_20225 [Thalassobaculum sp.]